MALTMPEFQELLDGEGPRCFIDPKRAAVILPCVDKNFDRLQKALDTGNDPDEPDPRTRSRRPWEQRTSPGT